MASGRTHRLVWRAAVALAVVALVGAGIWVWQRPGDVPAYEVVAIAPLSDEIPVVPAGPLSDERSLVPAGPPAVPAAQVSTSLSPAASQSDPGSDPGPGVEGTPEPPEPSCDRTFTYWDGDAQRTVALCSEMPSVGGDPGDRRGKRGGPSAGAGAEPLVFRSESGVEMTLEHSIVLVLDAGWSGAEVNRFLVRNGIRSSTVTPMGWLPNGFVVSTGPGIAPLVLANALARQDGVVMSSPNWASEYEAK